MGLYGNVSAGPLRPNKTDVKANKRDVTLSLLENKDILSAGVQATITASQRKKENFTGGEAGQRALPSLLPPRECQHTATSPTAFDSINPQRAHIADIAVETTSALPTSCLAEYLACLVSLYPRHQTEQHRFPCCGHDRPLEPSHGLAIHQQPAAFTGLVTRWPCPQLCRPVRAG